MNLQISSVIINYRIASRNLGSEANVATTIYLQSNISTGSNGQWYIWCCRSDAYIAVTSNYTHFFSIITI